jgi:hypothetical protein
LEEYVSGVNLFAGLMGCLLIVQGISVLRTGSVRGVFALSAEKKTMATKPTRPMQLSCALMHIVPGVAVILLLVFAAIRSQLTFLGVMRYLRAVGLDLLGDLGLVLGGVLAMVRPSVILGWAKRAHPDLNVDAPAMLVLARVIGIGLFVIGGIVMMNIAP